MSATPFADLNLLATDFRQKLENKKYILLYAYNGTGKTRLSTEFKDIGKAVNANGEVIQRDTLYFNAFTEDLFTWHNDLDGDSERFLILNASSSFFAGLEELEMDNRIRPILRRYTDFDFRLDKIQIKDDDGNIIKEERIVRFSREVKSGNTNSIIDNIKISRGEQNIFVWCFFIAIVQLAIDDDGSGPYSWVKFIYIDDPISSLDDHNAIAVANHLGQLFKNQTHELKIVISSHHTLFFNVLFNEFGKAEKYFLSGRKNTGEYLIRNTGETPFFQHVAILADLYEAARNDRLYTFHFNMLRAVLEKTASFHGYSSISVFIKQDPNDQDGVLHKRILDILSHGNYSLYEPQEMQDENKVHFKNILDNFLNRFPFNPELFPEESKAIEVT